MATLSALATRLNIKARDGGDITFTPAEKTEALTTAFNDPYVVNIVRDATTTTAVNVSDYPIPATITKLLKVGQQISTYGKPANIEGWNEYGGRVYFDNLPTSGLPLVMIGSYKVTITDDIPDANRQEYVLVLAKLELLKYLQQSLANTFLTNDMTMGDLLNLENVLMREAATWRSSFINSQVIEL